MIWTVQNVIESKGPLTFKVLPSSRILAPRRGYTNTAFSLVLMSTNNSKGGELKIEKPDKLIQIFIGKMDQLKFKVLLVF